MEKLFYWNRGNMEKFGQRLHRLRMQRGLSRRQLETQTSCRMALYRALKVMTVPILLCPLRCVLRGY